MKSVGVRLFFEGMIIFYYSLSCTITPIRKSAPMNTSKEKKHEPQTGESKNGEKSLLESLFMAHPTDFREVLANRDTWNVQVIYTQIDRQPDNKPILINHYFNLKPDRYFYPASAIKLPVAALALEKLQELRPKGIGLETAMITMPESKTLEATYNEPNSKNGTPNIHHYLKKIFLISDNDAFNRLYEFIGQEEINQRLTKKGFASTQILHRLGISLSDAENRKTNTIQFYDSSSKLVYMQESMDSKRKFEKRSDYLGKGYFSNGKRIDRPMDFSQKNRMSLEDMHRVLISIIMPEAVDIKQRFNITEGDKRFLLTCMSQYPGESVSPSFPSSNYQDAYGKYILYGAEKAGVSKDVRIFNKVGMAYGHLLDVAYVVDYKRKIEFFVSAVIYANKNEILNDDVYDYDNIGLPFMKNLGKRLYELEVKRKRSNLPDLSEMMLRYDK